MAARIFFQRTTWSTEKMAKWQFFQFIDSMTYGKFMLVSGRNVGKKNAIVYFKLLGKN